jgi:hypothetical protein
LRHPHQRVAKVVDKFDGDAVGVDVVVLSPMEIAASPEQGAVVL